MCPLQRGSYLVSRALLLQCLPQCSFIHIPIIFMNSGNWLNFKILLNLHLPCVAMSMCLSMLSQLWCATLINSWKFSYLIMATCNGIQFRFLGVVWVIFAEFTQSVLTHELSVLRIKHFFSIMLITLSCHFRKWVKLSIVYRELDVWVYIIKHVIVHPDASTWTSQIVFGTI